MASVINDCCAKLGRKRRQKIRKSREFKTQTASLDCPVLLQKAHCRTQSQQKYFKKWGCWNRDRLIRFWRHPALHLLCHMMSCYRIRFFDLKIVFSNIPTGRIWFCSLLECSLSKIPLVLGMGRFCNYYVTVIHHSSAFCNFYFQKLDLSESYWLDLFIRVSTILYRSTKRSSFILYGLRMRTL